MEIERKYKVNKIPQNIHMIDMHIIHQGYLGIGQDSSELRIRKIGEDCYLTCKSGSGYIREEIEFEISTSLFESLWPKTIGKRINKKRIKMQWAQHVIEVDIFIDPKSDLMLAEVEFASEEEGNKFTPPDWFGEEVTNDINYRNQNIAK